MSKEEENILKELTEKEKSFCKHYIFEWNGADSARRAGYSEKSARQIACELLTKPYIQAYIKEVQGELEKNAGISRLKVLNEHKKIAFSSMAHLHNTWIERKDFDKLTDEQKECIEVIDHKTIENKWGKSEQVKIKLYDKQKALDSISKMLGYNEPDKIENTLKGLSSVVVSKEEHKKKLDELKNNL